MSTYDKEYDPDDYGPEPVHISHAKPKRQWVGLTRREFDEATSGLEDLEDCWIAIEAKLKERNE